MGIAFKDITENFLTSLYLSLQKPFEVGDLVELTGLLGYVQSVTARTTVLMNLDGNHVQIPNSTVFTNTIHNYTSNPNRRDQFGIGFPDSIPQAQETALNVLQEHPAVLNDPEPWVLVNAIGASTVNLRIYFWIDGRKHSWLKVRSVLIRLTKRAFQNAGIQMPDGSREIIFPQGVPVHMIDRVPATSVSGATTVEVSTGESVVNESVFSTAEGRLSDDANEIQQQAKQSRMPEAGENLLEIPKNEEVSNSESST